MFLVKNKISIVELTSLAEKMLHKLVKGVVDVEQKIMVIDAEMHVDLEEFLLDEGSNQKDLWGINLYPSKYPDESWLVFDSVINIRPSQNNPTRDILCPVTKKVIREIVNAWIQK